MAVSPYQYESDDLERPTTANSFDNQSVVKYIGPRTIGLNQMNSFQGSLRNFTLTNTTGPTVVTSHGLAALVHPTNISPLQSVDGDRTIDEFRHLSKLNQTLNDQILLCCQLESHNRAQELQIEWLSRHTNQNSQQIEKMFRTEIESAQRLIDDAHRHKGDFQRKLTDVHQTTLANDEHYQQLLAKRNSANKDLFNYQRQLAQNRAEIEFLRARVQQFSDEIQFYSLKNDSLHARQVKLRYELDEEVFAKQVLQMEFEVLSNEKITNEDVHASAIDDLRNSIDLQQVATVQPSTFFREQLSHELRRIRIEFEKKIEIFRDEIHRRFELEHHRYQMYKIRPTPIVNQEHEQKLSQNRREKKEVDQQITVVRNRIHEVQVEIEEIEKKIREEKIDDKSLANNRRNLLTLKQIIEEREQQLKDVARTRNHLKQQIENYRDQVDRHPRRSFQLFNEDDVKTRVESAASKPQIVEPPDEIEVQHVSTVSHRSADVEILKESLNRQNVDEVSIIRILCNRNVQQRLTLRENFKQQTGENLRDAIEKLFDESLKKLFTILLFSSIEHDSFELRRVLTTVQSDENLLIEILLTRTTKQIELINDNYFRLFKSSLAQDMSDGRDSYSRRLALVLLENSRPENDKIDADVEINDGKLLHQNTNKWRMDGSTFIDLIKKRNNESLRRIFDAYQQFSNVDIEQKIKTETDVELSRSLMTIVRLIRNRPRYFAYELRKSLKGVNTNEENLNRIIVSRSEIDMNEIKSEYEKIAKRTLYDQIQTDTNGNYRRALLELLRQRLDSTSRDPSATDFSQPTYSNRPFTQLKEVLNKQLSQRFPNTNLEKRGTPLRSARFDRNNEAKSNTLLRLNSQSSSIDSFNNRRIYENSFEHRQNDD